MRERAGKMSSSSQQLTYAELQGQYKKENKNLGEACASLAVNAVKVFTPKAPIAAVRVVKNAVKINKTQQRREEIHQQGQAAGGDLMQDQESGI